MLPTAYQQADNDLNTLVNNGVVPMSRIDDAVTRDPDAEVRARAVRAPVHRPHATRRRSAARAHRAVAARRAAESQVLLKNAERVLPLAKTAKLYVAGSNADNIGNQAGGWTLTWQGAHGRDQRPGHDDPAGHRRPTTPNVTFSATASAPDARQ